MLAEVADVLRALRLASESEVDIEAVGPGVERWAICPPRAARTDVVLRGHPDAERAANHVAVVEVLARVDFPFMPRPLAALGDVVVEEGLAAVSALSLVAPEGSVDAAMRALAAVHTLDVREGRGWDVTREEMLPTLEPQLHRLGFASHEREAAAPWLAAARDAILLSPWGFGHGDATAQNVLLAPRRAWLVSFHASGLHPQLFDVAAFLLTAGLPREAREAAAVVYANERGLDADGTRHLVDVAGILWGIGELLTLPRRSIEIWGDDGATAALNTAAVRIERGIREAAGGHAVAAGIRSALWPS